MFKRKTVLILGAGASNCHGFPTGPILRDRIINLSNAVSTRHIDDIESRTIVDYLDRLRANGEDDDGFSDVTFHGKLSRLMTRQSQYNSIDSFLRLNKTYSDIGRFYINWIMLMHSYQLKPDSSILVDLQAHIIDGRIISPQEGGPKNIGWYGNLLRRVTNHCDTSPELKANNNLEVVTFNYDLSLEHFFEEKLFEPESFRETRENIEVSDIVKIHHVYGKIPRFHLKVEYGEGFFDAAARTAYKDRQLISLIDRSSSNNNLEALKKVIQRAEHVVLAGFAFDPDNCETLDLPKRLKDSQVSYHLYEKTALHQNLIDTWAGTTGQQTTYTGHICDQIEAGLLGV